MTLKEFLIEEKQKWLQMEKGSTGIVREVMSAQIRMADAILIFLASKQTEEDMGKLRLTLAAKPLPLADLKPRQHDEALTEELIELAKSLEPGQRFPLDNLPEDVEVSTIVGKLYALRSSGKIPENVYPAKRTVKDAVTGKKKETVDITRRKGA